jgi:hypothetical protein
MSITPKFDKSWYIKWVASILLLSAMMFRSAQVYPFADLVLSFTGVVGWTWVGMLWKDRALIVLNVAALMVLGTGILKYIAN